MKMTPLVNMKTCVIGDWSWQHPYPTCGGLPTQPPRGPQCETLFRVGHKFGYAVEDELHRLQNELSRLQMEWDTWRQAREAA